MNWDEEVWSGRRRWHQGDLREQPDDRDTPDPDPAMTDLLERLDRGDYDEVLCPEEWEAPYTRPLAAPYTRVVP